MKIYVLFENDMPKYAFKDETRANKEEKIFKDYYDLQSKTNTTKRIVYPHIKTIELDPKKVEPSF